MVTIEFVVYDVSERRYDRAFVQSERFVWGEGKFIGEGSLFPLEPSEPWLVEGGVLANLSGLCSGVRNTETEISGVGEGGGSIKRTSDRQLSSTIDSEWLWGSRCEI